MVARHFSDDATLQALADAMYQRGAPETRVLDYADALKDVVTAGEIVDWAEVFVPAVELSQVTKMIPATQRGGKILATIKCIATSDRKDLQAEKILQDGVDWRYFAQKGWINDVHDKGTGGGLGYPTSVKPIKVKDPATGQTRSAHEVTGVLLDTQKARDILDLYKALDGHDRALGSSIQGPVILRLDDAGQPSATGRTIAKMLAIDLSLTRHPVNVDTYGTVEMCEKSIDALGTKLRQIEKDCNAGHPVPTFTGGGTIAPLLRQDHQGRRRMKAKDTNVQKYLDSLSNDAERDEAIKGLQASGVEFVEDGASAADQGAAAKALAYDEKLAEAMLKVKDHLEKGGKIAFAQEAEAEAALDSTGTLRAVLDGQAEVIKGLNAVAKGILALSGLGDVVKGMQPAAAAPATVDLSGTVSALNGMTERLAAIEKDLGRTGLQRYVNRPDLAERRGPGGTSTEKSIDRAKVAEAFHAEFARAEVLKDDAAKAARIDELCGLANLLDTGSEITEKDLTRFGVKLA